MRITQGLSRAVCVRPDSIATIDGDRGKTWTQVHDRVARIASGLAGMGVAPGDRVAVLAQNCDFFFECYFAIQWAGAVIVPLNTRLALAETEFQVADAGVKVLFYGREFEAAVQYLRKKTSIRFVALDEPFSSSDVQLESLVSWNIPAVDAGRENDDLAGIFYTGGTTGLPKGVMLSHRNLIAMAMNLTMELKVDEDCVNLHSAPMFHLADIGIFMTTMVAGRHVFVRKLDEEGIFDAIETHGVTHLFTVPSVIERLSRHARAPTADISSVKMMGYGGAPMHGAVLEHIRKTFPHIQLCQGFGMTEMGAATFLSPRYHELGADPEKLKSAGRPCFGYELKIVDEDGREVPRRSLGEIVGRGDNVMLGYWNRPEETAEVLKDGWMHSRDAGFMDEDGFVYITDRLKDMIVSGGENVYSIEVENVIYQHPAVLECAVVGIPDEKWGESVHAIVALKPGQALTAAELEAFCKTRIAGYKSPRSLAIHEGLLPRSAAGKVLKAELRKPYWQGWGRNI